VGKVLRRGTLLLVALGALAGAAPAAAATFYVSNSGSDASNDCTNAAAPCNTIAQAVASSEAAAGAGTIELAPGTYAPPAALTNVSDYGLTIAGTGSGPGATVITGVSGASAPTIRYGPGGGPGELTLSNLTVVNPTGDNQTAISGSGALTLDNVVAEIGSGISGSAVSNAVGPTAITSSTVTTAGTGRALVSSSGTLTLTNSTVSLTNTGDGSPALAVQNGAATISGSTITSAGNGAEAYQGQNASLSMSSSVVSASGHAAGVVNTFGNVALSGDQITMPDSGDGSEAMAIEGGTLTMADTTVSGVWTGAGLQTIAVGGSIVGSSISTADGGNSNIALAVQDATPGTALLVQRSIISAGAGAAASLEALDEDVVIDSSLIEGGQNGVYAQEQGGKSNTTTIDSSTVDAGVPGTGQQVGISSVAASATGAGNAAAINVSGSIILQRPSATVVTGGTASVTCVYDDLQALVQTATTSLGAVACPSGAEGNTSSSPSSLFVSFGINYQLLSGSTAVDQVPESAVTPLPDGFTASSTDLAGNPRVVDGTGDCIAVRDRGAYELQGHGGPLPAVTVSGPATLGVGRAGTFTASVPNVPSASLTWVFSDGATATGASVTHAFAAPGAASATVTATASPATCTARASASITVVARPALARLRLRPGTFAPGKHGGAKVTYTDTQASTTTFTVLAAHRGRLQGKRCHAPTSRNRKGKACTLEVALGHFSHLDVAGANHLTFRGMLGRKPLPPGTYTLEAVASNANGAGKAIRLTFTVTG